MMGFTSCEKMDLGPSGVETPEESTAVMSCLKARPTKLPTFSAAYSVCLDLSSANAAKIKTRQAEFCIAFYHSPSGAGVGRIE